MAKAAPQQVALERSPSHLLHRALQHALDIYVEQGGAGAPTQRQFAVLSAVSANEGLTQTDLVRATGIDRSTLAELVARMIGKGLLARARSTTDGRANTVRLTTAGRAALRRSAPRVAAADERILSLVPQRERDGFLSVLLSMSKAAEQDAPAPAGARAPAAAREKSGTAAGAKTARGRAPAKTPAATKTAKTAPTKTSRSAKSASAGAKGAAKRAGAKTTTQAVKAAKTAAAPKGAARGAQAASKAGRKKRKR
jgi:DNA-binding MarR family transcriptional regulator